MQQLAVQQLPFGGKGDSGKDAFKLMLEINLEVDIQIKARVHGDVTLSLLYVAL